MENNFLRKIVLSVFLTIALQQFASSLIFTKYSKPFFCRVKQCKSIRMPQLLFKFNSVQPHWQKLQDSTAWNETPEEVINIFYKTLIDNPTIVLEVAGHCDIRESNKDKLSFLRAKYVVNELIKNGISKKRLTAVGSGAKQLLISNTVISKAETKKEKEALHLLNRRIAIRVLNFDYKEEQ